MLLDFDRQCESQGGEYGGEDVYKAEYVDLHNLPGIEDLPGDVETAYPIWAIDKAENMLTDWDDANGVTIISLAEYREDHA